MDTTLKQRILGIIVLLALLGICLTVLLHNNKQLSQKKEESILLRQPIEDTTTAILAGNPSSAIKPQPFQTTTPTNPAATIPTNNLLKSTSTPAKTTATQNKPASVPTTKAQPVTQPIATVPAPSVASSKPAQTNSNKASAASNNTFSNIPTVVSPSPTTTAPSTTRTTVPTAKPAASTIAATIAAATDDQTTITVDGQNDITIGPNAAKVLNATTSPTPPVEVVNASAPQTSQQTTTVSQTVVATNRANSNNKQNNQHKQTPQQQISNTESASTATSGPRNSVIQVGSFSLPANARTLVEKLHSNGFAATTQRIQTKQGPMIRVIVGNPGLNHSQAEAMRSTLSNNLQLSGFISPMHVASTSAAATSARVSNSKTKNVAKTGGVNPPPVSILNANQ